MHQDTATAHAPKHDVELASLPGLSKPAQRALHAASYTHLDKLTTVTEIKLLALHGMGPKGIAVLRSALHARGKSFAGS